MRSPGATSFPQFSQKGISPGNKVDPCGRGLNSQFQPVLWMLAPDCPENILCIMHSTQLASSGFTARLGCFNMKPAQKAVRFSWFVWLPKPRKFTAPQLSWLLFYAQSEAMIDKVIRTRRGTNPPHDFLSFPLSFPNHFDRPILPMSITKGSRFGQLQGSPTLGEPIIVISMAKKGSHNNSVTY